jgi:hypothetical protein
MPSWIFTFEFCHRHPTTGARLENHYVEISAPTETRARQAMFDRFGAQWSMEYPSKEDAGVELYHLKLLERIEVK